MTVKSFSEIEISSVRTNSKSRFRAPAHFSAVKLNAQCEEDERKFDYLYSAKPLEHLVKDKGNIYIYGKPGNGKTHSALWIGNLILRFNLKRVEEGLSYSLTPVVFVNCSEYITKMKVSWDASVEEKQKFAALRKHMVSAKVLILDDIGYESSYTQFNSDEIGKIITERYDNGRPIIFTSNRTPEEIVTYFRPAVQSRMFNTDTIIVEINGRDMR